MNWSTPWAIRCVSIITLFVLLGIALSGVKWIIRFQLLLIFILGVAVFDYVIGTLAQVKPGKIIICDALCNLVPFVQFKKHSSMGVFHVFEIVQMIPNRASHHKCLFVSIYNVFIIAYVSQCNGFRTID